MSAPIYLTSSIRDIAARLDAGGFRCLVVGGAVRDAQLGRAGKDIDLSTDATPEQVAAIFPAHRGTTRFGTTLLLADGELIELTTFRDEADYDDFRRPSQVRFVTDPVADLSRRDFTINAMAYDIGSGQLIDPFGGANDLKLRRIRAVGKASERFAEDALRILRAVRFAAQLDFVIEPATASAMAASSGNLKHLSAERIGVELDKLLSGTAAARALREMDRLRITAQVLPELAGRLEHPATLFARSDTKSTDSVANWALLFHHVDPKTVAARLVAIALGTATGAAVADTLRALQLAEPANASLDDVARSRVLRRLDRASMNAGLALAQLCARNEGPISMTGIRQLEALLASGRPLRLAELAINGDDVMRTTGKAPGPWLGETLNRLLDEAAAGRLSNTREALFTAI